VGVFCLGIAVSRRNALQALARSSVAAQALRLGLVGGPIGLALMGGLGILLAIGSNPFVGGLSLPALAYALWEQLTGLCLGLGLMNWFSQHLNRETPFLRWLADRSFGVYVFHTPFVIAFTMLFQHLHAIRFVLAALLTIVTLVASYLFADVIRRLPGLRAIF
jgi:peptidoglycan/LPS O-acetylase OafA/YrhL